MNMKFITKIIARISLVALLAFSVWYLRYRSSFFLIRDVPVEVSFASKQEALVSELKPFLSTKLQALKGTHLWTVPLKTLQHEILENPWVKQVELSRRFPDYISAHLYLENVAMLFVNKKNQIFPVLENSKVLPKMRAVVAPHAPVLRNNNIFSDDGKRNELVKLFLSVPRIGPLMENNIAVVDYNSVSGLTLELVKQNVKVHLGKTNIQTKALQVLRVIDYLESQKQEARVIDASFTKKVLVRLRKRS